MTDIRFKGLKLFQKRLSKTTDFKTARVSYHARLSEIWADAAEAFVRAAMRKILVQTGMSAASFLQLARDIKRNGAEEAINSVLAERSGNLKGIAEIPSGARRPGVRGIRAGRIAGSKGFIWGTGKPSYYNFRFNFQTTVFQHAFHEQKQQTISAGFQAFEAVVRATAGPAALATLEEWLTGTRRGTTRPTNQTFFARPV